MSGVAILILDKIDLNCLKKTITGDERILYCNKWINSWIKAEEIIEDLKKMKILYVQDLEDLMPKEIKKFNVLKGNIPFCLFVCLQKWKSQTSNSYAITWGSKQPKQFWKKKNRGFKLPDFKTRWKTTVILTVCYWHKDQRNRIESPEKN